MGTRNTSTRARADIRTARSLADDAAALAVRIDAERERRYLAWLGLPA